MAGVRNINMFNSLIETWDEAKELAGMVEEDPNYYLEVQEKGMNSIQSNMDTLKATMQDFWYNFLNQDAINSGLQGLTSIAEVLSSITKTAQGLPAIGDTLSMALLGTGAVGIPALIDNIWKSRQNMKKDGESYGLFGGIGTGFKQTLKDLSQLGMSDRTEIKSGENAGKKTLDIYKSLFGALKAGFTKAQASGSNFFKSTGAGIKTLWNSLSGIGKTVLGLGAAFLTIEVASKVFDAVTTTAEESRKAVSDAKNEFDSQTKTLRDNKESIDGIKNEWASLSKGVDTSTNENISLTNDEYQRYLELNNQIAEVLPNTVGGFDAQGNAILSLAGDVQALNNEFSNLAQSQARTRFNENASSYFEEFDRLSGKDGFWDQVATSIDGGDISDTRGYQATIDLLDKISEYKNVSNLKDYIYGEEGIQGLDSGSIKYLEDTLDISNEMTQEDWDAILGNGSLKAAMDEQKALFEEGASGVKTAMQDYLTMLTEGDGEYRYLDDSLIGNVSKFIESANTEQVSVFGKNKAYAMSQVSGWLEALKGNNKAQSALSNLTSLTDQSSLEEIISAYKYDLQTLSDALGLDKNQLKEQFNLKDAEDMQDVYKDIIKSSEKFKKTQKDGNKQIKSGKELMDDFIDSQNINSLDALQELYDKMQKFDSFDDLKDSITVDNLDLSNIEEQLAVAKEGVTQFKDSWQELNDVISSSYSFSGMTSDEVEKVTGWFSDLESFDANKLFEDTFSGIRMNADELNRLKNELADSTYDEYNTKIDNLENTYQALCKAIANASTEQERNQLIQKRDATKDAIEDLKLYTSELEGTISAVNRWNEAVSGGEKGDLYDTIADSGIEGVEERYKAGEVGTNEFKSFVEMISSRDNWDTAGIEDYVRTYEQSIGKIKSWFTEEPGAGLNTFLSDLHSVNSELAYIDDSGNWQIVGDVKDMADSLGVSESLIDTILSKLSDMGFDIDFTEESNYLRGLREEAQSVYDSMDDSFKKKYDLDINADSIEDIDKQLENIDEALDFTEAHGIDETSESLRKMKEYLEALKGEKFEESVDFDSITDPAEKAAAAFEKLDDSYKEKYDLKIDADDIDDVQDQIENLDKAIEDAFSQGDSETVEELQAIKDNYESLHGGILDVEVDINNYEDLEQVKEDTDYLRDNGIVDLDIDWDNLTPDDAEKGIEDVTSALNGMADEDGNIDLNTNGAEEAYRVLQGLQQALWETNTESNILLRVDTGNLDSETQQIVAEFANIQQLAYNLNSLKATPGVDTSQIEEAETKLQSALSQFSGNHQAIAADLQITGQENLDAVATKLTNLNATQTLITLGVDSSQIDGYQPTDKQQNVKARLDKSEVETWTPSDKQFNVNAILNKGNVDTWVPARRTQYVDVVKVGGDSVNGNAHVSGNANANGNARKSIWNKGKAFAHGVWGAAKSGVSLVGELGEELIVRGNNWFTVGSGGAEMRQIKKGDIINLVSMYSNMHTVIYLIAGTT